LFGIISKQRNYGLERVKYPPLLFISL